MRNCRDILLVISIYCIGSPRALLGCFNSSLNTKVPSIAAKKVSLVDVGVVGGLSDFSDEREKGPAPTYHMGQAMGAGSGLGRTGSQTIGDDFFSQLSGQQYQFGGFQK